MNDATTNELAIVQFALALHLDVDPDQLQPSQYLEEDLGLDALDLVLIVLRLEELAEVELPVADLEHVRTVGDLVAVVRSWTALNERLEAPSSSRPSVRSGGSGMYARFARLAV